MPPTTQASITDPQHQTVHYVMSQPIREQPQQSPYPSNSGQSQLPEAQSPTRIECDAFELAAYLCDDFCRVQILAQYGLCNITDGTCVCVGGTRNSFSDTPGNSKFNQSHYTIIS